MTCDVSVVIPAYNAAWCLADAIDSVCDQTYQDYEIIIVNDGSTDDTARVAQSRGNKILYIAQPHAGLSAARNRGIVAARGQYVAFLDADDLWLPQKLSKQIEAMEMNRDAAFSFTDARVEDRKGRFLNIWTCSLVRATLLETLFYTTAVSGSGSGVVARKDALIAVGLFDTRLSCVEDLDMWMRMSARYKWLHVPKALLIVRRTCGSMSSDLLRMRWFMLFVRRKNRYLLGKHWKAYRLWNDAYAGCLADTGKWLIRNDKMAVLGVRDLCESVMRSPLGKGRIALSLLVDCMKRQMG